MLCIGIDISKNTFHASGIYDPQTPFFEGIQFDNTSDGFVEFLHFIDFRPDVIMCMESTGVYGEKLWHHLHYSGYAIHVEPPQYVRRAFRLKRKNDNVDSRMIAEYAYRYADQLHPWKPQNRLIEQIRTLLNNRELFQKEQTAHKNMLKAIQAKEEQKLTHYHQKTIEFLKNATKELDEELKKLIEEQDNSVSIGFECVLSVPGVGWQWAANFYIATGGFQHLNYRQIAAYLGLVPYEYDSGTSVHRKPKTDRRGSDQFRRLLYLSAISIIRREGKFKQYYQTKKAEGKNGKVILNNIQNKLLKIACACVREKKPYHEGHRSINPLKEQ